MTPPADFPSALVASALGELWGICVAEIRHAAVGFGSHHWNVVDVDGLRWFATLDDYAGDSAAAERGGALGSAFRSARALADSGLPFVVAPHPGRGGAVVCEVSRHRWVSVTPWLDAARMPPAPTQTTADRGAVVAMLADLHAATSAVGGLAYPVHLAVPERQVLDRALAGDLEWPGDQPYSDRARTALSDNAADVESALTAYDSLSVRALEQRDSWVITHGEPHARNVLVDEAGLHVVDWDTARLAPPARDLWHVVSGADAEVVDASLAHYQELTGRTVSLADLDVQALRWDLEEVALYVAAFSRPHAADEDSATAWGGLTAAVASLVSRGQGRTASAAPAVHRSSAAPR